ncbi:MAG: prepilin-type N-terminal cleavage/methylation domain-containing protein [Phycisphaerales bacterium]|nr:prepilin-type N-terminal cleavage/methylation domain-containing protein [Phycisphaerales bacterium]
MKSRGMTLLEVLIAIALGLVLLGSVTSFAWSQLNSRKQILEAADARRSVTLIIDRLEQDLISSIAGTTGGDAGVAGKSDSISVLSRGVAPSWTDDPATMIGDLHQLVVKYQRSTGQIEMSRAPLEDGDRVSVLPGLFSDFRFRYFDGTDWQESWNSLEMGGLPVAVEVRCWYGRPEEEASQSFDDPLPQTQEQPVVQETSSQEDESIPDRVRVILVPDAQPESSEAGDANELR